MNTGYHRHAQQAEGSTDPGWMLICALFAVALCLIALPWIVIGFLVERYLARWLHWKLSFLLWTVLLFACAFILYSSYQHGLQSMITHKLADYIQAAKHNQYDLAHWPLRALWADTWPVWLHTVAGIGIAGFAAELTANRSDTVRTLRQQEQNRQHRAQRAQRRARKRSSRPTYLPDQISGAMVIGVPQYTTIKRRHKMGDLSWTRRGMFTFPQKALHLHATALGSSGSGKTETLLRAAYGAHNVYRQQVVYLDAKGETKREDEQGQDNAARFVATMTAAGAKSIQIFPSTYYNGWHGTPAELKNRLLSVIDFSESAFYGDVAANALDLALGAPTTPRSSAHFLANLRHDRLKAIYKDDAPQYRRVLALDKHLLQQVEMRYQVFFSAMAGQLDGTLDYANADAVYLRVRGFALRNEAPRLGRFFVADFMHYMAERRRAGVQTLFIIDEFNALRMREETSILFEQVRSFGGNLIISAQGYAGLGPHEYAERILDACSTYILHACSDPGPVSRRAGKKLFFDVSWSEDEEGNARKHIRPRWDWRVPESAVMQQEEGQAFWISRARAQHVQTAMVPINAEQVRDAWSEIHRQEEMQRALLEVEERRRQEQQAQKQAPSDTTDKKQPVVAGAVTTQQGMQLGGTQRKRSGHKTTADKKQQQHKANGDSTLVKNGPIPASVPSPAITPASPILSSPDDDDDEPDRL